MSGLLPYRRTLAAGRRESIGARGNTIILRDTLGELSITARSSKVGSNSGQAYTLTLRKGEKWFCHTEFDSVEVENTSGADQFAELFIGYGDVVRDPPHPSVAPTVRTTTLHRCGHGMLNIAEWFDLLPENPMRKRYRVGVAAGEHGSTTASAWNSVQLFGRSQPRVRFVPALLNIAWQAASASAVTVVTNEPPVPPLMTGGVASGYFGTQRYPNDTNVHKLDAGTINTAKTALSLEFNTSTGIQAAFDHILLANADGGWARFNSADASWSGDTATWDIGDFVPVTLSVATRHQALIVLEGEFEGFGEHLRAVANHGPIQWGEWVDSTDSVAAMVNSFKLNYLQISVQEELYS